MIPAPRRSGDRYYIDAARCHNDIFIGEFYNRRSGGFLEHEHDCVFQKVIKPESIQEEFWRK